MLAERLAQNGIDVFRFDYFGLGDSGGESTEISVGGAVQDTVSAIEELRDVAQVRRITLLGLRLGAAIAARAASRAKGVDAVVLWDPVSDGARLLRQLRAQGTPTLTSDGGFELHGFPLPDKLQEELKQIRPESFDSAPSRVLLAVSEDLEEHGRLAEQLSAVGADVEVSIRPNPPCWTEQGNFGVGAMPTDLIQAIASWRP